MRPTDEGKPDFATTTLPLGERRRPLGVRHQLVVWNRGASRVWPLPGSGEVVVGRAADADIAIDAPTVSRKHARIVIGTRVSVVDLESRNATRVNGERVEGERPLEYGDVVTFGDAFTVFEELGGDVASPSSASMPADGYAFELGDRTVCVADPLMVHLYAQIRRLAESPLSVLVSGETGTGKDLAATALHAWSHRRRRPLLAINCTALSDGLAESELFGHERGAFTGATRDKAGLFETADGGTVFLDEIGDLLPSVQPKLLRVLESRRVVRVGSTRERPIDVRVVTATHRDLSADVRAGRFRQDLYYRLGAATVVLPPLRERPRELPLLARRFLGRAGGDDRRESRPILDEAMDLLCAHDWPGNVRELKNAMEYIAVLFEGPVTRAHVTSALKRNPSRTTPSEGPSVGLRAQQQRFEREQIEAAVSACHGNKTRAAKLLGIPLRTLTWKLKRLATAKADPQE